MKERINRLARGILDMDTPKVLVVPDKLEETVQAGKTLSGEFHVNSENSLYIKGLAYTNHTRVKIDNPAFGGMRNRVSYQIDAGHLENGDKIEITDLKGRTITYEVYTKYIVDPYDVSCTSQLTDGRKDITLITCTNDNKQRVIVKATEVK